MMRLLILAVAALSARVIASPDPVADTRQILAGTVTTKSVKQAYLSGAKDSTTAFQGALAAYKAVRAAEPPLKVTCIDGTIVTAPGVCPVPPPTPPPTPEPVDAPGSFNDPIQGVAPHQGAADISTTDHDVMQDIAATSEMPPIEPGAMGAFRLLCRPTGFAYDDHVAAYQKPGEGPHFHQNSGHYEWTAGSNYGNLRMTGGSGCNDVAGFDGLNKPVPAPGTDPKVHWAANRTSYIQPALLDGKGNVIIPDYVEFYYKMRPLSDPSMSGWKKAPSPDKAMGLGVNLPNGIKFLFGQTDPNKPEAKEMALQFEALFGGKASYIGPSMKDALDMIRANPAGGQFVVRAKAPECWNSRDLDSADHRSHMAYASYTLNGYGYLQCPESHPDVVPSFTYIATYTVLPSDDGDIHFSSDEMDNSKPRGWSFHADYGPMAWDRRIWNMIFDNCLQKILSCTGGNLGNGYRLKGAMQPIYNIGGVYRVSMTNPVRLVPVPPRPTSVGMAH
jgi:hypothetical protein